MKIEDAPQYVLDKQAQYMVAKRLAQCEDDEWPGMHLTDKSCNRIRVPENPLDLSGWSVYDTRNEERFGLKKIVERPECDVVVQVTCRWTKQLAYETTRMYVGLSLGLQ